MTPIRRPWGLASMLSFTPRKRAIMTFATVVTMLACIAGFVVASDLLVSVPAFAGGDDERPTITFSELYKKGRPPNFYSLGFAADDNVCNAALRLLNEPASIPPGLRMPYDYAKIDTALFLNTKSSVAWEKAWLAPRGVGKPRRDLDIVNVSLFNEGMSFSVFRVESFLSGFRIHALLVPPAERAAEVFHRRNEMIEGLPVYEQQTWAPEYTIEPDSRLAAETLGKAITPWSTSFVFVDILQIDKNNYVLVMPSILNDEDVRIYLVKFQNHRSSKSSL